MTCICLEKARTIVLMKSSVLIPERRMAARGSISPCGAPNAERVSVVGDHTRMESRFRRYGSPERIRDCGNRLFRIWRPARCTNTTSFRVRAAIRWTKPTPTDMPLRSGRIWRLGCGTWRHMCGPTRNGWPAGRQGMPSARRFPSTKCTWRHGRVYRRKEIAG